MKGKYLIVIAFLASWTVITASKSPIIFEAEDECPAKDSCPPKLISDKSSDCTRYYECKGGQKQSRFCTPGLFFSMKWRGCVSREISDCPGDDECPAEDPCPPKLIPDESSGCTRYYECKGGQKQLRSCTPGLFFSMKWRGCVSREISDCPGDDEEKCPLEDTCPPKFISHESDCSLYYECIRGQKQPRSCAPCLFFSKSWGGCVSREISDCPSITTTIRNGICEDGQLQPHECICYKYYECKYGLKALRECQTGWHFNKNTLSCEVGECGVSITTPSRGECVNGELLPHECVCYKYYECKNERKALRECQADWHFDKNTLSCQVGVCYDSPSLSICQEGELFSHEYQCNKYYQCKDSRQALRECENGWHFDKNSKTCVVGECDGNTAACVNGDKRQHYCDCNKYYTCNNEDWFLERCPNGLHFNISQKKCMTPNEAVCIYENIESEPGF